MVQLAMLQGRQAMLMHQMMIAIIRARRNRRRRQRSVWVRPWLSAERRLHFGDWDQLMNELRLEDEPSFYNFVRLEPAMFDELLQRVGPRIRKMDTNYRSALEPGLKLAITLRYLATGDKYTTLQYQFRVARNTISLLVPEVCKAITHEYKHEMIMCPTSPEEWRAIANEFLERWNIPHACGALDGKHVAIRCPSNTGSLYYNYKGFFSVVLMALVDAKYKFIWVDIGGLGSMSDCQIFNASELKECLENCTIGFPESEPLPFDDRDTPYFILGDDAFGLRTFLMKPYSQRGLTKDQRIFNYRISRGRRVVENAFGILAQRFQVLLSTIQLEPDNVRCIVEACICLHNLMRVRYPGQQNVLLDREDNLHNIIPGAWRENVNMQEVESVSGPNRDTVAGKRMREYIRLYFNSPPGSVPWQDSMI